MSIWIIHSQHFNSSDRSGLIVIMLFIISNLMEDEIMNIKKILVKSFVGVSVLSALLTTGISTYAKDVIREFSTSDFDSSYTLEITAVCIVLLMAHH